MSLRRILPLLTGADPPRARGRPGQVRGRDRRPERRRCSPSPRFRRCKLKRVRYIVPGTGTSTPSRSPRSTRYMNAARAAGQDVLVVLHRRAAAATSTAALLESKRLQGAERERLQDGRSCASDSAVPVGEDLLAPGTRSTTSPSRPTKSPKLAARYYNVVRASALARLHGRGRRRARLEQRGELPARVPALRQGQPAPVGPAQLRRRQPPALAAARRPCCAPCPARCG